MVLHNQKKVWEILFRMEQPPERELLTIHLSDVVIMVGTGL